MSAQVPNWLIQFAKSPAAQKAGRKGISTLQKAWRNRQSYAKMARKVNTYRKDLLNSTGENPGKVPAKGTRIRSEGFALHPTNTLWVSGDPLAIDRHNIASYLINQRERDIIFLNGFKVCMTLLHNLPFDEDDNTLYVNIAFVSGKHRSAIGNDDFFRNYTGTQRSKNFNSTDLSPHERHCVPINNDDYNVHWHERFLLTHSTNGGQLAGVRGGVCEVMKYIPINRQIRFETEFGGSAETQFRLLMWVGRVGEAPSNPISPTANAIKMDYKIVTSFREPEVMLKKW